MKVLVLSIVFAVGLSSLSVEAQQEEGLKLKTSSTPNLSQVLEKVMNENPRLEALEKQIEALRVSRSSLLWNLVNFQLTVIKNFGGTKVQDIFVPGPDHTNSMGFGVQFSPAILFARSGMAKTIEAQATALAAAKQEIAIQLVKIWLEYYFLAGTAQSYEKIIAQLDSVKAKVEAADHPSKTTDLQRLMLKRNEMEAELKQHKLNLEIARINYRRLLGSDPVPAVVSENPSTATASTPVSIEKIFNEVKDGMKKTFPLPTLDEGLKLAFERNPQLLIARYTEKSGAIDHAGSKSFWMPSVGVNYGRTSVSGVQTSLTNQWSASVTFAVPLRPDKSIKAKALQHDAQVLSSTATWNDIDADLRILYAQLDNLDTYWDLNLENFKMATLGLSKIGDPASNVTESLDLLDALLASWAGPRGFNALTTMVIMQKAQAHGAMGTLFQQIQVLKEQEAAESAKKAYENLSHALAEGVSEAKQ